MNSYQDDYIIKTNSDPIFEPIVYSSNTDIETSNKNFIRSTPFIWSFIVFIIGFLSLVSLIWSLFRFYSYLTDPR